MEQQYLQTAFEIKTMCDELSRRLLRWHWEQQEGRTLRQLADYVALRTEQAPEYYSRIQPLNAKTTWQQLDTTICTRILLDPGDGADERPLRLLSAAPRPVVARQSCNGLRMARNAAAHASSPEGAAEAAAAFAEAIEKLDDGYGDAVFTATELEKYRKAAVRAINLCREAAINSPDEDELPAAARRGAAKPSASAAKSSTGKNGAARTAAADGKKSASSSGTRSTGKSGTAKGQTSSSRKSSTATVSPKASSRKTTSSRGGKKRRPTRKKKKLGGIEWLFLILGAVVLVAAVWLRGKSMGVLG